MDISITLNGTLIGHIRLARTEYDYGSDYYDFQHYSPGEAVRTGQVRQLRGESSHDLVTAVLDNLRCADQMKKVAQQTKKPRKAKKK